MNSIQANRVFVHGSGAVSPAGWEGPALSAALAADRPLPASLLAAASGPGFAVRRVPAPAARPAWLAQARLRRSSAVTHFAIGAALEALGDDAPRVTAGEVRLGIVCAVMTGGVNYSRRFFAEVLEHPATASPLLFPETVFNAPAAHLGAVLGATGPNYTLVADETGFLEGMAVAAGWLADGAVDGCLVVATEEADWLTARGLRLFARGVEPAEGSGALYLRREPAAIELAGITEPALYVRRRTRSAGIQAMRAQLPAGEPRDLLVDSATGRSRPAADAAAWRDWPGARVSPRRVLGEGFAAAGAWACVAAVRALAGGTTDRAVVSVAGSNLQALGAAFARTD